MKYNLFIGRYQAPHKGHQAIFDTYLSKGQPVLIAVRDVHPDFNNPFDADTIRQLWEVIYKGHQLVKVIVIPDIASVNYGRGVGYEVNEIEVSQQIANISATEIREQILEGNPQWKNHVDSSIWGLMEKFLG